MSKCAGILFLIVMFLFFAIKVIAQNDTLVSSNRKYELSGYLKYLHQISFTNADDLLTNNLIHNRINFKYNFTGKFSARIEVRNRLFYGELVKLVPDFASLISYHETIKLSNYWIKENSLVLHSMIDRLSLNYTKDKWDVTLGRQRINWGINTVWTPNDIFNTYNYFDFDYEERPGSDALRIQYQIKSFSGLELAIRPGKDKKENAGAILYRFNKKKYDVQLLAGVLGNDYVVGGGWAGNIKDAGFKGELSYFQPGLNKKEGESVFTASISADYVFENGIYLNGSVLYNSNGADTLPDLTGFTMGTLSAKNLMPFRYTSFIQIGKAFTPIFSGNISVIYSPAENSLILFPSLSYGLAENWELSLVDQSFFTEDQNSYRNKGNILFMRVKFSF